MPDAPMAAMAAEDWSTPLYRRLRLSPARASIRLLHIRPGAFDDQIICGLTRTVLIASDPYEALSYTWGDATQQTHVTVNGIRATVTTNLDQALRGLRYVDKDRIIWVDALCINQHDLAERGAQVREMGTIYRSAIYSMEF
ncbi:hypothetical protein LTR36_004933 [Oleoguttula mirabilis]|uniref:Heterokaryon incompatibility domain-containing protein n=1 Tax=Oleoguttula mirabilis TaxID=1507867 RepID=A0AAV9JX25_9PEZI|nr:hypothetical protein LTR36_004933 [Oleoguttula mirabilis]